MELVNLKVCRSVAILYALIQYNEEHILYECLLYVYVSVCK